MQELIEALTGLTSTLGQVLERERQSDDGESTWDELWFVYSKEKGEVEYKSEDAAREGGRYWFEHSEHPGLVDVFSRERRVEVYRRKPLDRQSWMKASEFDGAAA